MDKDTSVIRGDSDIKVAKELSRSHKVFMWTNITILALSITGIGIVYGATRSNSAEAEVPLTQINPGAETNYDKLPYIPPTTGRIVSAAANAADIQSKANAAQPGDIIEVADGTYGGNIAITSSGTQAQPIIIRAKNRHGTTVNNCGSTSGTDSGCFWLRGNYVVVQQFKFTGQLPYVFRVSGNNNVVYDNLLQDTGNGQDGSVVALINIAGATEALAGGGPVVQRNNMIVHNEFVRPKNTSIHNHEGSGGNIISHNIIRGPHGMDPAHETEAIKNGCCGTVDMTKHYVKIQFNSYYNYGPSSPYITSYKYGDSTFNYNKIINNVDSSSDGAHFETRQSNIQVVGNLMIGRDGGVTLSNGTGQLVKYNKFFATGMLYGKGTLQLTGTGCYGPGSCYSQAVAEVSDNVIYNSADYLLDDAAGQDTSKASGSTFRNNVFLRNGNGSWVDGGTFGSGHTWENNIFHCLSGCSDSSLSNVGITLGTNGNRAGDPGTSYNLTDPNQTVPYDSRYVAPIASGAGSNPPSTTPPSPTPAPSPTPTPTPTPAPTPVVDPNAPEAEAATLLGNPATKASNSNVGQSGAGHTGYSGAGYVYSWAPQQTGSGVRFVYNAAKAGTYDIVIRYTANAADEPKKDIKLGGASVISNLSFVKTSSWDTWGERRITLSLAAGNNTIEFLSNSSHPVNGWMNIDKISLSFVSAPAPAPGNTGPTTGTPTSTPPPVIVTTSNGAPVQVVPAATTSPTTVTTGTSVALNSSRFQPTIAATIDKVVIEVNGEPAPVTNGTAPDTALDTNKLAQGSYAVTERIQYKDGSVSVSTGYVKVVGKYDKYRKYGMPAFISVGTLCAGGAAFSVASALRKKRLWNLTHITTGYNM